MSPPPSSPHAAVIELCLGALVSQAIYTVTRLRISDLLTDGPKSCEELAAASGTRSPQLLRLLRSLTSFGIFEERDGRFFQTARSDALRQSAPQSIYDWLMFNNAPWRWQLLSLMPDALATGETAYESLFDKGDYAHFQEHAELNRTFNLAMASWSASVHAGVLQVYDFSQAEKIVDVGGGIGSLLASILQANPRPRGVLFDQPHVIADGIRHLQAAGVAERCECICGSFFDAVPAGGDVYLLCSTLTNLTDDQAQKALTSCRRAMRPDGVLLLIEPLFGAHERPSIGKMIDILVLLETVGHVREEAEYRALFSAAGLRLRRTISTGVLSFCLIEGVPDANSRAREESSV